MRIGITAGILITFTVAKLDAARLTGCVQEAVACVTPASGSTATYGRLFDGALANR